MYDGVAAARASEAVVEAVCSRRTRMAWLAVRGRRLVLSRALRRPTFRTGAELRCGVAFCV
jgi:hypothetical protein